MHAKEGILVGCCAIAFGSMPLFSLAQTITVTVGACAPMTGTGSVNIATTCGNVTISNVPNYTARVRAVSDGTTDNLVIENAQITTTAAVTNFPVQFSAPLAAPPSAPPGPKYYYAEGSGQFSGSGGAPIGDSIRFKGMINPSGAWDQIGSDDYFQVACGTCGSFSPGSGFTTYDGYGSLTSPRDLRGEIEFTMNNTTDQLKISSIKVRNGPPPGDSEWVTDVCGTAKDPRSIPSSEQPWPCRWFNIGCIE